MCILPGGVGKCCMGSHAEVRFLLQLLLDGTSSRSCTSTSPICTVTCSRQQNLFQRFGDCKTLMQSCTHAGRPRGPVFGDEPLPGLRLDALGDGGRLSRPLCRLACRERYLARGLSSESETAFGHGGGSHAPQAGSRGFQLAPQLPSGYFPSAHAAHR